MDLAEQIAALVLPHSQLSTAEVARELARRAGYEDPLPKKKAFRVLVEKIAEEVGPSRLLHAAYALAETANPEPAPDWPLKGGAR